MKYVLLVGCFFLQLFANAQTLLNYKDTVYHFSIGLPDNWSHEVQHTKSVVKLVASGGHGFINVTIIDQPSSDVHAAFRNMLRSSNRDGKLNIIDTGSVGPLLWVDDMFDDTTYSTVFVGYDNNKAYVYSGIAHTPGSKSLFHKIGETFRIGNASKEETLKLVLPFGEWSTYVDQNNFHIRTAQFIPVKENVENWTGMVTILTQINSRDTVAKAVKRLADGTREVSPLSKTVVLEHGPNWALVKVEGTAVRDAHPSPASQLWYMVQGKSFHTVFITVRERSLTDAFVKKWGAILKKSYLTNE